MSKVLCLLAHPDDEIFCADLLTRLTDRDRSLHLACLTRGEGGRHHGDPPRATAATLGAVREREMRVAARVLGADGLTFLDYVDPPSTDGHRAPKHDAAQLTDDLQALIEDCAPALLLTHGSGGEYGHPAHRLLHERTVAAVDAARPQPALYTFGAYRPEGPERNEINRWDWADLRLDTAPRTRAKVRALTCHRTQWTAFVGRQDTVADYRAALDDHVESLPAETYSCHRRGYPNISPDVLATWVEGLEPFRRHPVEALRDELRKYRHKARITVGEGLLALRQRLR
ncbi:LmbE family N-acetylglucosaminyl deacetylase [Salinibacter ruber]|uniref:PIG-L deacetylase family protein n=1 Tax=Salinibacter ruber TaxID=146919 RepID=UPI0016108007|nr:PIG-L deacetylase family protein [Salinibacter ruber]MBB4070360.1 LmbE family N-acetylglucosaminyl deacetylase [Salinibacter ruber]